MSPRLERTAAAGRRWRWGGRWLFASGATSLAVICSLSAALADSVERRVEFRDGSHLMLQLDDLAFKMREMSTGRFDEPRPIRLAEVNELVFSEFPARERVRRILEALKALGSEAFAERERAALQLVKLGQGFRPLLEQRLREAEDPDYRWRMLHVLRRMPRLPGDDFDYSRSGGRSVRGEFEPWQATADYRGTKIILNRSTVRAIRSRAEAARTAGRGFEAITTYDSGLVPEGVRTVGFEQTAMGERLVPGESVEEAYAAWGVRFSTSIEDSFVAVNKYKIDGAAGDQAAATKEPIFEGVVTARFCVPGVPDRPAGVHFVSCRLAVVHPGGTALVAIDLYGNEIGRAVVQEDEGPHSYLAVRSGTPIAAVQIVPDLIIDPDYTFDDLVFDTPTPLNEAPSRSHHTIALQDGGRLHCGGIVVDGMRKDCLRVDPPGGFASALRVPLAEVTAILTPSGGRKPFIADKETVWALFADGSKLMLNRNSGAGEALTVAAGLPVSDLPLCALWNADVTLQRPVVFPEIGEGDAVMVLSEDPNYLKSVELDGKEFSGKQDNGSRVIYTYRRLPSIWFRAPPEDAPEDEGARLVTSRGEIYRFGIGDAFELSKLDDSGVHLRSRFDPLSVSFVIRWHQIAAAHLTGAMPASRPTGNFPPGEE